MCRSSLTRNVRPNFLGRGQHQEVAYAGKDSPAPIAHWISPTANRNRAHLFLWNDLIDQPLEYERSEKCQKTPGRDAQATGHVPVQKWPDLL